MSVSHRLIALGLAGTVALSGGALIAKHEGLILGTYIDPVGIVTSCYGHTGKDIQSGQPFTDEQCLEQLATDLSVFNRQLLSLSPALSEGEHAAYLSFVYNVGINAYRSSTLRRELLAGNRVSACRELPRWVYADGRKLQGLINRRNAEMQFCLKSLDYVESIKK